MKKGFFIVFVILLVPLLQAEEWDSYQSEHFIFYYKQNHLTQAEIVDIAEIQEELFTQITDLLNIDFKGKITYYLYKNEKNFKFMVRAYCSGRTIHVRCDFCQDMCKHGLHDGHELTHALCTQISRFQCRILAEGVAVYVHNYVLGGESLHGAMKILHEQGTLPTLRSIYFDFWSSPYNYSVAGSFVTFLIEEYGMEKFKLFYMGMDSYTVYKKSLDELEYQWIETITGVHVTADDIQLVEYITATKEGINANYALGFDPQEYGTYPYRAQEGLCLYREFRETDYQTACQYLEQYNTAMVAWKDAIETFKKGLETKIKIEIEPESKSKAKIELKNIQKKCDLFEKAAELYGVAGDWEMMEKSQKYAKAYQFLIKTRSNIQKKQVVTAEKNLKNAEELFKELGEPEDISVYYNEIQTLHQQLKKIKIGIVLVMILGVGIVFWIKKNGGKTKGKS